MTDYKKTSEAVDALDAMAFNVTQNDATEPPFTGALLDNKEAGLYVDIVSGEPLFLSLHKYESGCGWPSFTQPVSPDFLKELTDTSHGMTRVEVRSKHGDSHLGHVFPDGPREATGLRYCINSAALRFVAVADMAAEGYGDFLPHFEDLIAQQNN